VIFRHPARLDAATGKAGRRVRKGLGTSDDARADELVDQLNEMLRTEAYWEPSARDAAAARFDARAVEIFFDGLEASDINFSAVRDESLPLPRDHRKVLLLGTTGAGKTTVVRQILGTDPLTERFPSTSTAKTTIADTELILTDDATFRAVVTFASRDEVIDHLTDNVSEAALAAFRNRNDDELRRRLLDHVNQRFRFSYILGRPNMTGDDDDLDDDLVDDEADSDDALAIELEDFGTVDLAVTQEVVSRAIEDVRAVVAAHADEVRATLAEDEGDERIIEEYIEENLDTEIRQSEEFHRVVDSLVDEVEKRFALLDPAHLQRNRQGWPVSWSWWSDDREAFIKAVTRFSSNYAPFFGRLLTPLVNGVRVSGPFLPTWMDTVPPLVLIDGEGLGHTPNSAATLSTPVAKRLEEVDRVLLVDNAAQPMQAAPVAALKAIAASGNSSKLTYLFTHFDQVEGDNLPRFSDREIHVLSSVENVIAAIGDELGPVASRSLAQRLERSRFFVGDMQEPLDARRKAQARTIGQLRELLSTLAKDEEAIELGAIRPVYDRMNLSLAVAEAAKSFHASWRGMLGIDFNKDIPKEHWTRVKALTRRLAEGWADEYDTLKPVADLRYQLQVQILLMLQRPVRWEGGEPDEDEKQQLINEISNAITKELFSLTERRLKDDVRLGWQEAYAQSGPGSTFVRARIVASQVYEQGAPIPTVTASPDQNQFLHSVAGIVTKAAQEFDLELL
jgi:hypothetical protein